MGVLAYRGLTSLIKEATGVFTIVVVFVRNNNIDAL